jgi:hypothetical protein
LELLGKYLVEVNFNDIPIPSKALSIKRDLYAIGGIFIKFWAAV